MKHSLVLVFWAYLGLESASVAAAVVENPERNVAIATIAGVLLAALIYIVVSAAMMGLAPASDLANSSAPFALVAGKILGPVAGPLVAVRRNAQGAGHARRLGAADRAGAAAPRPITACCRRLFARTRAGDTPVAGLITAGSSGTVGVLVTISPTLGKQFGLLSEASTLFCLLMYLGGCAAAIKYRLRGAYVLAPSAARSAYCDRLVECAPAHGHGSVPGRARAVLSAAMRRKYLLPDAAVRTGTAEKLRERFDDPG